MPCASELIRDVMFRLPVVVAVQKLWQDHDAARDLIGSLSGLGKRVIVVDTSNEISGRRRCALILASVEPRKIQCQASNEATRLMS